MPKDLSSFQKDLVSPEAGKDSELYRAIVPLLDLNNLPEAKTKFDQERIEKLKNDLRQGTLGLEYLTGLKNNKVETFFDAHPAQATISNVLGNSGKIGLGVAAGGTLTNALRQWKNLNKTQNAFKARENDPIQQAGNKLNPIGKDGKGLPVNEDILRVFGAPGPRAEGDINFSELERRMNSLDSVSGSQARPMNETFASRLSKLKKEYEATQSNLNNLSPEEVNSKLNKVRNDLRNLMQETRGSKEYGALKGYVDLSTDLQRLKDRGVTMKGGVGSSIGDRLLANDKFEALLRKLPTGLQTALRAAIPTSAQPVEELVRDRILHRSPNNYSDDMVKSIIGDTHNTDLSGTERPLTKTDKIFNRSLFGATGTLKNQSVLNRLLRMGGAPVAAGAGIAGVGLGLDALLKLIQSKVYGKEQINEWKRNALKAKGEFEEANRIK